MARAAMLRCWWGDTHVADLEPKRRWDLRCRYTELALERWPIGTPVLSCSLPLGTRPLDANAFLAGLLPEGRHLQAVADLAKIPTNDIYGLLARYGRDIAGAIVITAEDDPPTAPGAEVRPYSSAELDDEVGSLDERPLGLHPDSELSLAGVQNKLLLVDLGNGRWGRPIHGAPSTHILKVDDDRYPGLVRAEAACLRLAHAIGLTNAPPLLASHGGRDCVIVARYDRRVVEGVVTRAHQEDACQALGVDIGVLQGRGKYEAHGGPTLAQIAGLLRIHGRDPTRELERLVRLVTFTIAIGNADLHGKNVSLLHDDAGRIALAPAYDTVPTVLWSNLRSASAVSVDGTTDFSAMSVERIGVEASGWGLRAARARAVATDAAEEINGALTDVIDDPDLVGAVTARVERLLA